MKPTTDRARALSPGSRVGRYEIVSFLAQGGMGEVYRARDTQLERDVAVKVLPSIYGSDAARLKRFEQEARAVIRLNHPNIVTVYDIGRADGLPFIVTEFLEGRTLASLLRERRLPIPKALQLAIQIARGLSAAHDKGIVHRDLKPANIFVTLDDHVKIVDFGLAKLIHPEWEEGTANEDTISAISQPGTILGSAGYMAPEQVQGITADHRADLFSFGAILYEMVSGVRAFEEASTVETMHAILTKDPPDLESRGTSRILASVVRRCLEKRPENRFQAARDLEFALHAMAADSRAVSARWTNLRRTVATPRAMSVLGAAAALIVLTIVAVRTGETSASKRSADVRQRTAPRVLSARLTTEGNVDDAAISPDGTFLAYVAIRGETFSLRLKHLVSGSEVDLVPPRAQWLAQPAFSDDSAHVYYAAAEGLMRVPLLGGVPATIQQQRGSRFAISPRGQVAISQVQAGASTLFVTNSDGSGARSIQQWNDGRTISGLAWLDATRILTSLVDTKTRRRSFLVIDAVRGERRALSICKEAGTIISIAAMSGDEFLFTTDPRTNGQIWFASPSTGQCTQLTNDPMTHVLRGGTRDSRRFISLTYQKLINLWRSPSAPGSPAEKITSGINTGDGERGLAVLPDGRIVFTHNASGHAAANSDLWIVDRDGSNKHRLTETSEDEAWPVSSPDGRSIVYVRGTPGQPPELWHLDLERGSQRHLTSPAGAPSFSKDGRWIYYTTSDRFGDPGRVMKIAAAGGDPEDVTPRDDCVFGVVSPDGKWIACFDATDRAKPRENIVSMIDGSIVRTLPLPATVAALRWTPDGQALVYIADSDSNLYILPLDGRPARPLTDFRSDAIVSYAFESDGKSLVLGRGPAVTDVYLLSVGRTDG